METSLAYTIAEACTATRTGKTALYEAMRAVKRGRRTLVLPADLKEWIEKLPTIESQWSHKQARRRVNDETRSERSGAQPRQAKDLRAGLKVSA